MAEQNIPTSQETEVEVPETKIEEQPSISTELPAEETPIVEEPPQEEPPLEEPAPVVPVEEPAPTVEAPAPKPETDYKKKFGESTRNNQIVMSRFNELQKVLGDITRKEVPTDDEMKELEPEWEYLTDREKRDATKLVVLERRQNQIFKTISDITLDSENARKLDDFIESEPKLKGKEDEFLVYASKDSNKGASMDVVLKAFLFDTEDAPPTPAPITPPATESAPSLERGNPSAGAPQDKGKSTRSADDLKELRTKNPREYNELIRKGLI